VDFVRRNWISVLVIVVVVFYVTLGTVWMFDPEQTGGEKVVGFLLTFVPAAALLAGLRLARRGKTPWARIAIGLGMLPTLVFWWMIFPVLSAVAVVWFGIVKGGLVPEPA